MKPVVVGTVFERSTSPIRVAPSAGMEEISPLLPYKSGEGRSRVPDAEQVGEDHTVTRGFFPS